MTIVIVLLLLAVAALLWLIYVTTDSFNQDLKQLRLMANQIERHLANISSKCDSAPISTIAEKENTSANNAAAQKLTQDP